MGFVVEIAADARAAQVYALGFEIKDLAEQAGLPMQLPIAPGIFLDQRPEFREQRDAERGIACDRLVAEQPAREAAHIRLLQQIKWQTLGRAQNFAPEEIA